MRGKCYRLDMLDHAKFFLNVILMCYQELLSRKGCYSLARISIGNCLSVIPWFRACLVCHLMFTGMQPVSCPPVYGLLVCFSWSPCQKFFGMPPSQNFRRRPYSVQLPMEVYAVCFLVKVSASVRFFLPSASSSPSSTPMTIEFSAYNRMCWMWNSLFQIWHIVSW